MYCPKCGTENPDDAQLCHSCSSVLTSTPAQAPGLGVKTSGLAIAALVLGILSFFTFGITAIPAIILGIISLVRIEKSGGRITGRGFAIGGIVIPVVALPVLLSMMILMPALKRVREQGRRAACLNNLRQLTLAWIMYADENDDRVINAVAGTDRKENGRILERAWTGKDWTSDYETVQLLPEEKQRQALMAGALWPYCKNTKLYRCPASLPGHMRTYSIVDSMNGITRKGTDEIPGVYIKKRRRIRNPAHRFVFVDVGQVTPETYSVYYDQQKWWDQPPVSHADGTTLSFADGHSEYWKWRAAETVEQGRDATSVHSPKAADHWSPQTSEGREDLQRMQTGCWGRLGYKPVKSGIERISPKEMIWVKCNNPDCKAEYEMGKRAYFKYIEENIKPMAMVAPPVVCESCGSESVYRAEKCQNPDCAIVFFRGIVPNDFADRCPECGRSGTEESRKRRRTRGVG